MNQELIAEGIRLVLEGLGLDLSDGDLTNTPKRYVGVCRDLFDGYGPPPEIKMFPAPEPKSVVCTDVPFVSVCEHHLLSIIGNAHVSYYPDKQIYGVSKIVRTVNYFSHRLQLQERLTKQIVEYLWNAGRPKWLTTSISALHMCALLRGPKTQCIMHTRVSLPDDVTDWNPTYITEIASHGGDRFAFSNGSAFLLQLAGRA